MHQFDLFVCSVNGTIQRQIVGSSNTQRLLVAASTIQRIFG
ncbi:hypothetical protein [Tengunoibacter tsumagoiensis]|nr:hypothetical protein [Tengunoibacter tsumagoiensis]